MLASPFQINPDNLKFANDSVLLRSIRQYRETLEEVEEHDPGLASKFAEILEQYEEEAQRRGLEV